MPKSYARWWFWGLIVLGALIPFIVSAIMEITYNPDLGVRFYLGDILLALVNDIPYILLAFLAKYIWQEHSKIAQNILLHKIGVFFAGGVSISFNLYVNIGTWRGIAQHLPGSSTAVIVYVFLPIYGIIAMLIGYVLGFFIGKIIIKKG